MKKDLYDILGVSSSANAEEIKRAYRDLAKRFHPDRTGGDKAKETRFKEISAAYGVLSDPDQRARYDASRRGGVPFEWPPAGGAANPFRGGGFPGLDDLFAQVFGGAGGGRVVVEEWGGMPRHGRRPRTNGSAHGAPPRRPPAEETVRAPDGTELLRRGEDLYVDVGLSFEEAVLGARVEVPTLDGRVTVTIPPGTSSGKKLRLRGKGLHGRGDLYATVQIVVPTDVDDPTRELIRELARRAPVKPRR